jgi:signal transduction histidine kinase
LPHRCDSVSACCILADASAATAIDLGIRRPLCHLRPDSARRTLRLEMLEEFIATNRGKIIDAARQRVTSRTASASADTKYGVPTLLTQIVEALGRLRTPHLVGAADSTLIGDTAALRGHELLRHGMTLTQVVNSYGDVCQVVTNLAGLANVAISAQEFQVFNMCLDEAVAGAVAAYGQQRERDLAYEGTERLGILVHEMRNLLNTMTLAFAIIRDGTVGLGGSTGAMLARSMSGLCALVDRSVAEVRSETGAPPKLVPISMVDFVQEMQISGAVHAERYGLQFTVHPVDRDLMVDADWQLLASAVSNLLQNAFEFSRAHGHVSLETRVTADQVLLDIRDECGGLPPGKSQELFRPFAKSSDNPDGLGLGLSIALRAARAQGGDISVQDLPGSGCVFTLALRRRPNAPASIAV